MRHSLDHRSFNVNRTLRLPTGDARQAAEAEIEARNEAIRATVEKPPEIEPELRALASERRPPAALFWSAQGALGWGWPVAGETFANPIRTCRRIAEDLAFNERL
jgi:hypothetical protein